MQLKSNLDQVIKRLQQLRNEAANLDVTAALLQGVNVARAQMLVRIFNNGLDKGSRSFGKYTGRKHGISSRRFKSRLGKEPVAEERRKKVSETKRKFKKNVRDTGDSEFTEYEKRRLEHGRQIRYKDLEFSGSLRRSIITANDGDRKAVCAINNAKEAKIAQYQETQIGGIRGEGQRARIFGLSDQEKTKLKEETNIALKQVYDRILRG